MQENPTSDRLRHVAKVYHHKPYIVWDTIDIVANAIGQDRWQERVVERLVAGGGNEAADRFADDLDELDLLRRGSAVRSKAKTDDRFAYLLAKVVDPLVDLLKFFPAFREKKAIDGAVTWIASQLAALDKRATKAPTFENDSAYAEAVISLKKQGAVLGMWLERDRPELNRMSLADVQEALDEFDPDDEEVPQGEVVYEFDDGVTVQKLTTKEQLDVEGDVMQHCVGGYCDQVRRGTSEIYSVRDANGRPHVTIEYSPHQRRFVQVRGKQNDDPTPKWQKYVDEFKEEGPLEKLDPRMQAMIDTLLEHDSAGHLEDDEQAYDAAVRWNDVVADAEELAEWLKMGIDAWSHDEVEGLKGEDVTPEELAKWPGEAFELAISANSRSYRVSQDDYVPPVRFAVMLHDNKEQHDANAEALRRSEHPTLPGVSIGPPRPPQHHMASSMAVDDLERVRAEFNQYGIRSDDKLDYRLANEWAELASSYDEDLDSMKEWYVAGFNLDETTAWLELQLDWMARFSISPSRAFYLQSHRITPSILAQAFDADLLTPADVGYKSTSGEDPGVYDDIRTIRSKLGTLAPNTRSF